MNTKHILIAALLAGAFAPASARSDDNSGAPEEVRQERFIINGQEMDQMPMHVKGVKNAPYSAEIVSEQQHNLADGNQIVNKSSSMSYRDSAGRTRNEIRDAGGVLRRVTINDAVEGTTYILNPEAKTATKIGPRRELARIGGQQARERIAQMREDGDERVIVKRIERDGNGPLRQRIREDVRIQMRKELAGGPHIAGLDRIGPVIAGAFGDMKWAAKASVKDLGTKEIDGIKAQGKMKSYEIPAGEIGNRNAIVVASESWYSPELQVTLLTRRSDPRTGERSWRMSGIKRDEPAAALFTVPSDYTVKDAMAQLKKFEKIDKK